MINNGTLTKISIKKSEIHGLGLFAESNMPKGEIIAEYIGEKVLGEEGDRRSIEDDNPFIMSLDEEYDIDGNCKENLAKFVNHSCESNVTFEVKNGKMWCIALSDISAGEELTTDYEMDCHELLPCACGDDICRHYMNHPEDIVTLKKEAEEELKKVSSAKA
ncbi:SET domain-containing protein-lysine N-methyltransferase [Candidatus Woesearchaeota archaeon]|nr:SET domain-containing protein-lysine N-methyltransferase [Candidatus Woesearchaeota archaeon]